jgi:hypothetical protein
MRFMKMIGLATMAAVASMAVVGVGSAAAQEEHRVVFCKTNETLCKEGGAWPDDTSFLGEALGGEKAPILLSGSLPVQCEESKVAGLTLGSKERHSLLVDIELLTFTGNCTNCPVVLENEQTFIGHINHVGEDEYTLVVLEPLVLFHECPIVGLCGYNEGEVELEIKNDEVNEGYILVLAKEEPLNRHAGSIFCPGSGEWDAHYLLLPSKGHEGEHLGSAWLSLLPLNE